MKYTVTFAAHDSMSLKDGFLRKARVLDLGRSKRTEIQESALAGLGGRCGVALIPSLKLKRKSTALAVGVRDSNVKHEPRGSKE